MQRGDLIDQQCVDCIFILMVMASLPHCSRSSLSNLSRRPTHGQAGKRGVVAVHRGARPGVHNIFVTTCRVQKACLRDVADVYGNARTARLDASNKGLHDCDYVMMEDPAHMLSMRTWAP